MMVLGSAVLFSFKAILIKYALCNAILADELIFWRIIIALPFFWAAWILLESQRDFRLTKTELITVLYMGSAGVALPIFCSYSALKYIDASVSVVIVFTYPTIVTLLSAFFFKEKIGMQKGAAVIMTYFGLLVVLKLVNGHALSFDYRGVLLAGLTSLSFATHQILAQKTLKNISQFKLSAYTSTIAAIVILFVYFPDRLIYQPRLFLAAGSLATLTGFIPILLMLSGMKKLGASRTSLISTISPVSLIVIIGVALLKLPQNILKGKTVPAEAV
jgi:drug/metabolite transporter (DMT)-like permease